MWKNPLGGTPALLIGKDKLALAPTESFTAQCKCSTRMHQDGVRCP